MKRPRRAPIHLLVLKVFAACVLVMLAWPQVAKPAATARVIVWHDQGDSLKPTLAKYQELLASKLPGVEVEWVSQDPFQISAKLVAAFAAKEGPDIVFGSSTGRLVPAELQLNAWADLAPYLRTDSEFKSIVDNLDAAQLPTFRRGQKLWGLPQVTQRVGLFVRKSWLDRVGGKAPADWEEMVELARRFTNEKEHMWGYGMFGAPGTTNSAGTQFEYIAASAGVQYPLVDPQGNPSFNTPQGVETARWMHRWVHEWKAVPPGVVSWSHPQLYEAVNAGQIGMGRVGEWNIGSWDKNLKGDFIVTSFPPQRKGQKNYQYSWSDGSVISSRARNKEAAFAVFKFLDSKDAQTIFYQNNTSAARTDLDWKTLLAGDSRKLWFHQQRDSTTQMTRIPSYLPVLDVLASHLNAMLADPNADPAKVLGDAYKEAVVKANEVMKR